MPGHERERFITTEHFLAIEPYIPIAEALMAAVDTKIGGDITGDQIVSVEQAWHEAVQEVASPLIRERLKVLPPDELLSLYTQTVGEDDLAELLKEIAALKARGGDRALRIEKIQLDSRVKGLVSTSVFQPEEVARIGLYHASNTRDAYRGSSLPPTRSLLVRWTEPESGAAEILNHKFTGVRAPDTDELVPSLRLDIGHAVTRQGAELILLPELSAHSPLGYAVGGRVRQTPEIVGFIETGDGHLLMNGYR